MRALIYLTVFFSVVLSNKIDINNTKNLDDLPLVENKIKAIERYISQNNGIKTIYDLLEIEEISSILKLPICSITLDFQNTLTKFPG